MNVESQINDGRFDEACRFVIKLGKTAHGYGPNASRLESYLYRVTEALGYRGVFRSTPTEIYFAFSKKGDIWQRTHVAVMPGIGLELARLAQVGELVDRIVGGDVTLREAISHLDDISKLKEPFGVIASALSYAFVGTGFAVLLSGSWWDVLFAALFSLIVYGIVLLSGHFGVRAAEWLPLSSAFVAGFLAATASLLVPELNIVMVTLSAILVLIPGFSISVGVVELVTKHVVSGTSNLMNGLVCLVKQFTGAWLGIGFAGILVSIPEHAAGSPVSPQWLWMFMPLMMMALCVVFQTSPRDIFWAFFGCSIAYGGILLGSAIAGGNLGNLFGTIIAVAFANLWARRTGRPTSIVLLPAVVLLVSGSIGFRGLAAVAAGQAATGQQQFLQMFVVALTIAAGLLVGNTIVRPKVTL